MAKRFKFKLKISQVFLQSCCSKDPSYFPSNPVPSLSRSFSLNPNSIKRHVSTAFSSIGCSCGSRSSAQYRFSETDHSESPLPPTPEFHWETEDRWHVVDIVHEDDETPRRKIYNTSENDEDTVTNRDKTKRRYKKKKTTPKTRISNSSSFEAGETETLVLSSTSLSTDSSSERHRKKRKKNKEVKKETTTRNGKMRLSSLESDSPARLSMFLQRCMVDGKVRESFAVVKKSDDPCEDFKRSMMEMILEKHMFQDEDLEQLLQIFLSLNSRHHHGAIVQAFAEIWEALFSARSTSFRVSGVSS